MILTALKILGFIFITITLIVFIVSLIKFGFKKARVITWWFAVFFITGLFGILTEWLFFFPAWFLRNIKFNLFWIWLDDSRLSNTREGGYAEDYEIDLNYKTETIWTAYSWHMRNRVWNLDNWLNPIKGNRKIIETVIDNLIMNGEKVDQSLSWTPMARLKYFKNGKEGTNVNNGEKISKKHSITGEGFVWTNNDNNRLGFRYSFCEIRPFLFFWKRWRILVFGENNKRPVFTIKHKRLKGWQ